MAEEAHRPEPLGAIGMLITLWAVIPVVAICGRAAHKLAPIALEPIEQHLLTTFTWVIYIAWCVFNIYAEGYRGFQKAFSPRVVARAYHAARERTLARVALAPFYAMCLFGASRKRIIVAWSLIAGITVLVLLVRMLDQPWRGIIDGGVVLGLVYGAGSILVFYARALLTGHVPPDDSQAP